MSSTTTSSRLNDCGCCEAGVPATALFNRPGLSALAYRIGTHSTFLRRMLARLPARLLPGGPTLAGLTTRRTDDLSIGLLDAWAVVADVLTFHQERIANEGFLRTATERRSVLELARAIGYELNPGVAASTYLAFTVEEAAGAPGHATVEEGTQVQSIPGQDERPQTFETIETIEARAEWNVLRPLQSELRIPGYGDTEIYLQGVDTGLKPGAPLLFIGRERADDPSSERWDFRRAGRVEAFPEEGYTRVTWQKGLGWTHFGRTILPAEQEFAVHTFRQRASIFGHNAPDWRAMPDSVKAGYLGRLPTTGDTEWPGFDLESDNTGYLDAVYSEIAPGSWIVLSIPDYEEVYELVEVEEESQENFTLTAKVTRLGVRGENLVEVFGQRRRDIRVFAQSEQLRMAKTPLVAPVFGTKVLLAGPVDGLAAERAIVVTGKPVAYVMVGPRENVTLTSDEDPLISRALEAGERLAVLKPPLTTAGGLLKWSLQDRDAVSGTVLAGAEGLLPEPAGEEAEEAEEVHEVAFIDRLDADDQGRTSLILQAPLENVYDRATVGINANVAAATHGETVEAVLGGGDGAQANQRFKLRRPPLTYVSAPTPSGGQSRLEVRVNQVLWEEVPSLFGQAPNDRSYIIRLDDEGTAEVISGDGQSGARLPSGTENVRAKYRTGIGLQGEVEARQLALLRTRPLGIRDVTNPIPATGAADPEGRDDARTNAPLTVLTLDRVVSLRDYEDFGRAFAGIGKAKAAVLWNGERRLVQITVASASGEAVDPTSALYIHLLNTLSIFRDPVQEVRIDSYDLREFKLELGLLVDQAYIEEGVRADVQSTLEEAFGFGARRLAQPVTAAEIITLVQATPGVVACDLNRLYFVEEEGTASAATLSSFLEAKTARIEGGEIEPAQLVLLAADGVAHTEMST